MTGAAGDKKSRIDHAQVDWSASAPRSIFFDDIYFSGDGAAEAAHVFLNGNRLAERFSKARRFSIGELGFGTGLNILMAWKLWRETPKPEGARLSFFSVEGFPLRPDDLARAHEPLPALDDLPARLRALLPPAVLGLHMLHLAPDVILTLGYGNALDLMKRQEGAVDAWFFDGFAPSKNPEMWRHELFKETARLSNPGATFATFTVAGAVRRAFSDAGFSIEKQPGFGRKKEMLAGRIEAPPKRSRRKPWFQESSTALISPGATVAIIGGGVAGASLAFAARRAGLVPTIIEQDSLAAGASGNPGGLVMPRLDLDETPTARFFLAVYLHTIRLLNDLLTPPDLSFAYPGESRDLEPSPDWIPAFAGMNRDELFNSCGIFLHAADENEGERQKKIIEARPLPPDWMAPTKNGLFFPQSGVVDPRCFVEALAGDARVVNKRAAYLRHSPENVTVVLETGEEELFDAVVLANSIDALRFVETRTLPLSAVAGQIDWFPEAPAPDSAIAAGPYVAPAPDGGVIIGATYEMLAFGTAPRPSHKATLANIEAAQRIAPDIAAALDPDRAVSRASFRCQTPDRLPVAGPLPDIAHYGGAYDDLRLGVKKDYPPGKMVPRVFILSGLGSRGLVTAPLAAEFVIAEMTGAPSPLDHEIAQALHPARFFIRELKRGRTIRKG